MFWYDVIVEELMHWILPLIDKLTKEEEEIYKLQHDLERTAISHQQSKMVSEVSSVYLPQICCRYITHSANEKNWTIQWVTYWFPCKLYNKCSFRKTKALSIFNLLSKPLGMCGWLLSHSRKRWSKLADSNTCRHHFPPKNGSPLPPSAESPVALATESQSPTTRDRIRLIVRGTLGSCSSSSECEFTLIHTWWSQWGVTRLCICWLIFTLKLSL